MFNGLRNLKNIGAIVVDRAELYSKLIAIEAKIETKLLMRRLIWAGTGIIGIIFAIGMLHLALVSFFWNSDYRILSIVIILLIDAAIAGSALYKACVHAEQESFLATKNQLAEDMKFVKESI